jgi:selenocysteine lyase/cysteine desulfurase
MENQPDFGPSRRRWLGTMKRLSLSAGLLAATRLSQAAQGNTDGPASQPKLPDRRHFEFTGTYLNAAYTHPLPSASAQAMRHYLDARLLNSRGEGFDMATDRNEAKALFARMINATADEIAWVPSTMAGENIVAAGLALPGSQARVVTDAYHFDGSLYLYGQLAKEGLDLHVLTPRNNGIDLNDLDAAITPGTRLVAISLVSMVNGFQHDLKSVCDLAHSRGALVYADIIQAAGAVPIDVQASGVDFCACATFKWLMGDFGAGFLYVRKDRLPRLKRSQYGYRQLAGFQSHTFPYDPPSREAFDWTSRSDTGGRFEVGTLANGVPSALCVSLRQLLDLTVERIQAHRLPLMQRLQTELPKLGFTPMTPAESTSPIVSFAYRDALQKLGPRLKAANINIQLYENRLRISPSHYNDMTDVERLIAVLSPPQP